MHTFIIRDVRVAGWKPQGEDVLEVDHNTPISWIMESMKKRGKEHGGDVKVMIICHGSPGYLYCGNGTFVHPNGHNGMSISDLAWFNTIAGSLKRLELHACLVARIGTAPELSDHVGYDGNEFCFKLAQTIKAEVKASIHLQYYWDGTVGMWIFKKPNGEGIHTGEWNGKVFTWDKTGAIINTEEFPYEEMLWRGRR